VKYIRIHVYEYTEQMFASNLSHRDRKPKYISKFWPKHGGDGKRWPLTLFPFLAPWPFPPRADSSQKSRGPECIFEFWRKVIKQLAHHCTPHTLTTSNTHEISLVLCVLYVCVERVHLDLALHVLTAAIASVLMYDNWHVYIYTISSHSYL